MGKKEQKDQVDKKDIQNPINQEIEKSEQITNSGQTESETLKQSNTSQSNENLRPESQVAPSPELNITSNQTNNTTELNKDIETKSSRDTTTSNKDNSTTDKNSNTISTKRSSEPQIETLVAQQKQTQNESSQKSKSQMKPAKVNKPMQNQPKKVKKHHYSFFVTSFLFGILITGGVLYHQKYPYGYSKIEETPKAEFPKVLALQDTKPEPTVITPTSLAPVVSGKAYGIFYKDKKTDQFTEITNVNENQVLPMASITKLMTALVAIDEYELDREVTIPMGCVNIKDGSNVGMMSEEIFTVQDLLYGLLVKSGADAGCALANIEKSQDFVDKMNQKASELGMKNTKFQNVIGFDAGDNQVSSIADIKILSEEVLKSSVLRKIIGTQVIEIAPKNNTTKYKFETTNDLLKSIPGTIGIKTGYTELAGECLTYLYSDKNHEILIVILGSQKRFEDTKTLLDWAKKEIVANNQK